MKTVSDYRALARARLPRFIFDYIDGGSITEQTLRAVAETGVDFISLGALTHSAPTLDISLLFSNT